MNMVRRKKSMKKVNILCVCGAGLGTSLMAKMKVDKLLK